MHTVEIENYKHTIYIPSDLSECSPAQYIDMCDLIFQYQAQKIDHDTFQVHAIYKLMYMKPAKSKTDEDLAEKTIKIEQLKPLINSFFETETVFDEQNNESLRYQIKQLYSHNPIPKFKPVWHNYYGPSDGFTNVKFGEYLDALRLFQEFHATNNMQLLYNIAAILYRPKQKFHFVNKYKSDYDGDCRIAYNAVHIEARAKTFKYAPIGFIYGVYLFFASFQKFVSTAQIQWGDRVINFSLLFDEDDDSNFESEIPSLGMDAMLFSLAESGAFGNIEQVAKTSFWTIMVKMYDARKREIDEKKQLDNAKSTAT